MNSALDGWQERFHQHFTHLHTEKGDSPLFALEHGLNAPERDRLAEDVRAYIIDRSPSRLHLLAWIVYAAEIGYGFSGDEFWQTFEQKTPAWTFRGDRGWLRDCFRRFAEKYGGAAPSGPWAGHFTIICWPITHAILPRDLQRHLARILYELRFSFSAALLRSPTRLGEYIAAHGWGASSRFQNLAETPQLIGQIAAALLLQDSLDTTTLLHPSALKRISSDLEEERIAKGLLQIARRYAQDHVSSRSLNHSRIRLTSSVANETQSNEATVALEPRLVLRPKDQSRNVWSVILELPDLSPLLKSLPAAREVLTQSRCTVAGSAGRPLARGQCLFGRQQVTLRHWPRFGEPLLHFDLRDSQFDALLRAGCRVRSGPKWLFRIASDGLAYEMRDTRVRAGQTYILAQAESISGGGCSSLILECDGISACSFSLPSGLNRSQEQFLHSLGLTLAKNIEVFPVGIAPTHWDGHGRIDILSSEPLFLGVKADHWIEEIVITFDSRRDWKIILNDLPASQSSFLELPKMPVGQHSIQFAAHYRQNAAVYALERFELSLQVRDGRTLSRGGGLGGPLLARVDPPAPSLEQLWEKRVEIAFQGPVGRPLACTVKLLTSEGDVAASKTLPALPLPVDVNQWMTHFERHFQLDRATATAYDRARVCELTFNANELGAFTLRCERESTPLRWILRKCDGGDEVWLVNDTGSDEMPKITLRAFERPQAQTTLKNIPRYIVPSSGGMYLAQNSQHTAGIIAPPSVHGLAQLGCNPIVRYQGDTKAALFAIWKDAECWSSAKVSGQMLSAFRQRDVRMAFQRDAMLRLCGSEWSKTETAFSGGFAGISQLQRAVWKYFHESEFIQKLRLQCSTLVQSDIPTRIHALRPVTRSLQQDGLNLSVLTLDWQAEFAFRAASDPAAVWSWAAERIDEGTDTLIKCPTLVRVARFLVLVVDKELKAEGFRVNSIRVGGGSENNRPRAIENTLRRAFGAKSRSVSS